MSSQTGPCIILSPCSFPKPAGQQLRSTGAARAISVPFATATDLPFSRRAIEEGGTAAPLAPDYAAPLAARYFNWRKTSIYGGSNEIQRNIIAQQVLGL